MTVTTSSPRRRRGVGLALLCALPAACGGGSGDDAPAAPDAVSWQPCAATPTLDCATLEVPLVHDGPGTRTLLLDLTRLPSTGDSPEPLLLIAGGPGSSGTDLVRVLDVVGTLPDALRERHDVIGFDPRGVGRSDRVDCADLGLDDIEDFAAEAADLARVEAQHVAFAEACHERHGDVLPHLGSNAVVRDMERIRIALGAERLHAVGYSYGTRLAALYLERFPDTSGRIVLDGPLRPDGRVAPLVEAMVRAQRRNLDALLDACGTRLPDCDRGAMERRLFELIGEGVENGDEEVLAAALLLYEGALDPEMGDLVVAPVIEYVETRDFAPLGAFIEMLGATGPAVDDADTLDNETVQRAVFCGDDPTRPTSDDYRESHARLTAAAPLIGRLLLPSIGMACAGWPIAPDPVADIDAVRAPKALVIAGPSDAQTPIEFAAPMVEALDASLLVSDHEGHTVLFAGKSACTDAAGLGFLLDGELPAEDACARGAGR